MYHSNQVVWSLDHNKPVQIGDDVWDTKSYPGKTTHFVNAEGKPVCPKSIEDASILLKRRRIAPALVGENYCWSCQAEVYQAPRDNCEAKNEHIKCDECKIRYASYGKQLDKMMCSECYDQFEKDGILRVARNIVRELETSKLPHDQHASNAESLVKHLNKLMDPYGIKEDGQFRDKIQDMVRQYKRRP